VIDWAQEECPICGELMPEGPRQHMRGQHSDHSTVRRMPDVGWMKLAACGRADVDPDWWFAELSSTDRVLARQGGLTATERRAKRVCLRCPVRHQCLAYCLHMEGIGGISWGIWGGTLPRERRRAQSLPEGGREMALELLVLDQAESEALCKEGEVVI